VNGARRCLRDINPGFHFSSRFGLGQASLSFDVQLGGRSPAPPALKQVASKTAQRASDTL